MRAIGNQRLPGGRVIPLGLSFLPQDMRRFRAEENTDPRLGSRNSPWYRLGYHQHPSRGPGPHGELCPGPGSLHPCPNHPLQLAFLDPVPPSTPPPRPRGPRAPAPPPPPPRPGPAAQGPLPTPSPPHPQISQGVETVPGGTKRFFFFLSSQDRVHPASPISHGGQGETQRNPSTPPKERKTLTSNRAPRSSGSQLGRLGTWDQGGRAGGCEAQAQTNGS